ncbi:hypothetical protein NBZ79_18000 [Sneathiella marina]|uniref:3-phosphoglycerate dehydrogenase n=1 Tax=Sneathiella marina TaxID=2950108 RepID=A0ABY4W2J0_9PROT|nr:NAD(P)-dependent oxidoreductase [Sneathiella marina]USG61051.1 hypothetical protein NBZ79_18000 [Sneathiella marina]
MTILMLETLDTAGMALLGEAGEVIHSPTPNAHDHSLPFDKVTAIITRGLGKLDRPLLEKCPNLKVIARCGAGLNNLDTVAAKAMNIPVVFAPGINATAVAEHVLMLIMMILRKGFRAVTEVKNSNWQYRNDMQSDDLCGKKVTLVGTGNIARKVAEYTSALSMETVMCGREGRGMQGLRDNLETHLATTDVLSLHIPADNDNDLFVDAILLNNLKPGAIVINTARGSLIDELAMVNALNDGHIAAYGADVMTTQPPPADNALINHPNTVVTPHAAALTKRTYQEMSIFTALNVVSILSGSTPDKLSIYHGAA